MNLGLGAVNFPELLVGYEFTILESNDLLTYDDLLVYEAELNELN